MDVVGQYVLNGNGGRQNEKELGRGEAEQNERERVRQKSGVRRGNLEFWFDGLEKFGYCVE